VSRRTLYLRGLSLNYLALGASIAYSLVSIPLALHYLGTEQFGLWAVVLSVSGYLQMLELGISHGVGRILIEAKDERQHGAYCSVLLTGAVAQIAIGATILLAGLAIAPLAGPLLAVPVALQEVFRHLLVLYIAITAVSVATRSLSAPLYANQRQDLLACSSILLFAFTLAALWSGFVWGWGLYAMVFASMVGMLVSTVFNVLCAAFLGYYPRKDEWRAPSFATFREIFSFSRNSFLMGLGWLVLRSSPVIIITRLLGLEATATWTVCTKPFEILGKFLSQPCDTSYPALSEMFVRGESERLKHRLGQLLSMTASLAVLGGLACAVSSPSFIAVWTKGSVEWPLVNYVAVAGMTVVYYVMRITSGFVGISKLFGFMPYAYLVEAMVFVVACWLLVPVLGVAAIPLCGMSSHLLLSSVLGLWYINRSLGFSLNDFLRNIRSALLVGALALPLAFAVYRLTTAFSPAEALFLRTASMGLIGLLLFVLVALDAAPRQEMLGLIRNKLRRAS